MLPSPLVSLRLCATIVIESVFQHYLSYKNLLILHKGFQNQYTGYCHGDVPPPLNY